MFDEHYLWNAVGNPVETTVCAAHLVLTGVLERHPALRVVLAHGGGAIAALCGGCTSTASRTTRGCCASWSSGPAPIASCSAATTHSTWPIATRSRPSAGPGLGDAAEQAVLGGNAARLLALAVDSPSVAG